MTTDARTYCTTLKDLVGDDDPLAILSQTPSRIQALITGVDSTILRHNPQPGKWSITEIVAHLADSELVFGFRLRMIFGYADGIQPALLGPEWPVKRNPRG